MKKITVDKEEDVRLDRFLRRIYKNVTQGVIERGLREGKIKVNKNKIKSNYRLQKGDEITLFGDILQYGVTEVKNFSASVVSLAKKLLSEYLILSENEFIAIDKPSGVAVQGGTNISTSIDDALAYLNTKNGTDFKLVHRLDKGTSGILLIACGAQNAAFLTGAFKDKLIRKIYFAVVSGRPPKPEGMVDNYIGKDRSGVFEIVKESPDGKKAETEYKIIKPTKDYTLIEFRPLTGRMHQLRVHSKILGCPILGDEKYGGAKYKRIMLHAQQLTISQEIFGREIKIESPLPSADWSDLFNRLT